MEREIQQEFEQLAADPVGTVYVDSVENGVRHIILRGPDSLCAYVGVPLSHPLAGHKHEIINLKVHGGLTFSGQGGEHLPKDFWWYGWDYGHCDDMCFSDLKSEPRESCSRKRWTIRDVQGHMWGVTYDFAKLMALAEAIDRRAQKQRSS